MAVAVNEKGGLRRKLLMPFLGLRSLQILGERSTISLEA